MFANFGNQNAVDYVVWSYSKFFTELVELSFGSNFRICQDVIKSANALHKWSFVDSQMKTNVCNMDVPKQETYKILMFVSTVKSNLTNKYFMQ